MTMPMVVRIVAIPLPASTRVPTTSLSPLTYLTTLKILMKPKGLETEALLLPDAGKTVAMDPMANTASKRFQ